MPPTREPSVTAVVVTWDAVADVGACLAALRAQDHPDLEVVVVDNGSTDGTVEVVAAIAAVGHRVPVRLVRNATNVGLAAAVNAAIARSSADAVLLVNPDAVLAPDHARLLAAALARDPGLGQVQGTLLRGRPDDVRAPTVDSAGHAALRARLWRNRGAGRPPRARGAAAAVVDVAGVTGAASLHRRAMLDDVAVPGPHGPEWLDETLFAYFDDVDLDWRAALRGWRAGHVPAAVAHHVRAGAAGRRGAFVEELNTANRLLVVAKLDDPGALLRVLPQVLLTTLAKLAELVLRQPAAAPRAVVRLRRGWLPTRRRRAHALARQVRSSRAVTHDLPGLDVGAWVRTWWRRARS